MKPKGLIAFLLLGLSAGLLDGAPPSASYRVTIEGGRIVVTDAKNGAYMGGTTFEKFGVTTGSTQDKLRHVALDTVAAVAAGNGGREHTVDPHSPVYTLNEYDTKKATHVTVTFEHGLSFFIVSDRHGRDHYKAEIGVSKTEEFKQAPPTPAMEAQATGAVPRDSDPSADKLLGEVSLPTLVKIVRPSVVQVIGYKNGKIVQTGSGFIAEGGAIVTNFHVVSGIDGAFIRLSDGSQRQVAGLAHYSEGADIAILVVPGVEGIRGLSLAPSLPEVGERIYVLGNPETFTGTLSDGLVSAERRDDYGALVQITAPISHGSSGSPVFNNGGLVVGVAMGSVESGQSLNFARSAGAVRAMFQSKQAFTTFGDLNKTQAEKEPATAASDPVGPPGPPRKPSLESPGEGGEQKLTRVSVRKYGVSALLPTDVFPDAEKLSSSDESFLQGKSGSGQTTLTFSSVREPLARVYAECATEHSPQAPSKTVDYKVLRPTWFVVSGDLGPQADSSLGFYTKGVKKDSVVVIMHFQYREDDFPFSEETFTAISRSFDGH